jgi:plastocyanin
MPRRLASFLGLGAVLCATLLWLVAAPGVTAGDPCYHGYTLPEDTSATATTVSLEPCAFAPTLTNVPVGTTVTFRNTSQFTHLITGANQAWGSRDTEIAPGASTAYAFDRVGLYPYACALHRGMSGVIVVGDAAAIAPAAVAASPAPSTSQPAAAATDAAPVAALALLAGVGIGAVGSWFVTRRRPTREETVAAAAS